VLQNRVKLWLRGLSLYCGLLLGGKRRVITWLCKYNTVVTYVEQIIKLWAPGNGCLKLLTQGLGWVVCDSGSPKTRICYVSCNLVSKHHAAREHDFPFFGMQHIVGNWHLQMPTCQIRHLWKCVKLVWFGSFAVFPYFGRSLIWQWVGLPLISIVLEWSST